MVALDDDKRGPAGWPRQHLVEPHLTIWQKSVCVDGKKESTGH